MEDKHKTSKLTNGLFIIYLIGLFWIIVFKFNLPFSYIGTMRSINIIPFRASLVLNGKVDFGEMILNSLIFVPLGIYSGILYKSWKFGKQLFLFFSISLLCEVSQYMLGIGASDITDIINNTLGGIIGLLVYKGIEKAFNNSVKTQKFINYFAVMGTLLVILLVALLMINNLWMFRMRSIAPSNLPLSNNGNLSFENSQPYMFCGSVRSV